VHCTPCTAAKFGTGRRSNRRGSTRLNVDRVGPIHKNRKACIFFILFYYIGAKRQFQNIYDVHRLVKQKNYIAIEYYNLTA
jgi:hypothetical protein